MNIFYLHHNPEICARFHNNKHCIKMILESAQLLSTAHHHLNNDLAKASIKEKIFKPTHRNHPSAKWVCESGFHYSWLWKLLYMLCKEYTYRYEKSHMVELSGMLNQLEILPTEISWSPMTEPALAMPSDCVMLDSQGYVNAVASYRKYYKTHKRHLAQWKRRPVPSWYS